MKTPKPSPFLAALGELPFTPEQLAVIFHTMEEHEGMTADLPLGDSRPHRARMLPAEPPPKPTSRCFPR